MIDGVSGSSGARGEGFAKLASFDSNGDGVVDALDARFGELLVWQDANQNHSTDAGELRSLADKASRVSKVGFEEKPLWMTTPMCISSIPERHARRRQQHRHGRRVFNAAPTGAEAAGSNLATLRKPHRLRPQPRCAAGAGSSAATTPAQPLVAESANDAGYSKSQP